MDNKVILEVSIIAPISHLWVHPSYYYSSEENAAKAIFDFLSKNKFMNKNYRKIAPYRCEKIDDKESEFTLEQCLSSVKKRQDINVVIENLVELRHSVDDSGNVVTTKTKYSGGINILIINIRDINLDEKIKEGRQNLVNEL